MPAAFHISNDLTRACSPTDDDPESQESSPSTTPNTSDSEINLATTPPRRFPLHETTRAPVHIPEHAPPLYYPYMHPYGFPPQPFGGFPYGCGPALPFPGYSYPPSFGFPSPMANLLHRTSGYNENGDQKENIFYQAQDLSRPKHHDVIREKILSLTRDRPNICTESPSRPASRSSENESPSPVAGRAHTSSFSSSDDTTKVSNTSLESIKNYPSTPSPVGQEQLVIKKGRTNYNQKQVQAMEKVFHENAYPDNEVMEQLSHDLDIPEKKLKNWFQNKRSRNKKKMQEVHHQMICPPGHPYYMPTLPPHMMPPFSPYLPLTSPNPMIHSSMGPSSLAPQSIYSFPGSSPLASLPGMLLPTQQYNHMS